MSGKKPSLIDHSGCGKIHEDARKKGLSERRVKRERDEDGVVFVFLGVGDGEAVKSK